MSKRFILLEKNNRFLKRELTAFLNINDKIHLCIDSVDYSEENEENYKVGISLDLDQAIRLKTYLETLIEKLI